MSFIINDTHRKELLYSILIFFVCLHNQLRSIYQALTVQMFESIEKDFLENKNLFQKTEVPFFSWKR